MGPFSTIVAFPQVLEPLVGLIGASFLGGGGGGGSSSGGGSAQAVFLVITLHSMVVRLQQLTYRLLLQLNALHSNKVQTWVP